VLVLATIAQRWRFEKGPDVAPAARITLRPKQKMRMKARIRT
jgi:hypothetical protein